MTFAAGDSQRLTRRFAGVILCLVLSLVLASFGCSGSKPTQIQQESETFTKAIGGTGTQSVGGIAATADRGFLIVGSTSSDSTFDPRFLIIRTDKYGSVLWRKTLGGSEMGGATAITAVGGDDYVVAGWIGTKLYLVRINSSGSILWETSSVQGAATCLTLSPRGDIVVAGSWNSPNDRGQIAAFSLSGEFEWLTRLEGDPLYGGTFFFSTVLNRQGGGFLAAGSEEVRSSRQAYAVSVDDTGGILSERAIEWGYVTTPSLVLQGVELTGNISVLRVLWIEFAYGYNRSSLFGCELPQFMQRDSISYDARLVALGQSSDADVLTAWSSGSGIDTKLALSKSKLDGSVVLTRKVDCRLLNVALTGVLLLETADGRFAVVQSGTPRQGEDDLFLTVVK